MSSYTESWLVGPGDTKFYSRTYLPPSHKEPHAVIVFVHGFAEHIGRYTNYHSLFASRDIAVFAYDQRGFGLTALDKKGSKSTSSSYGVTSWSEQMDDIAWAIQHAKQTFKDIPLFLMGHSMGGAEALGFIGGPHHDKTESLKSLSGVISTSPLLHQTHPAPKFQLAIGGLASRLLPKFLVPAPVKAEDLSHDPAVYEAYKADPYVVMKGTLKGLHDMLTQGDWIVNSAQKWPKELPVFIAHGTADQVTDCESSKRFSSQLSQGIDHKLELFKGGRHELHNEPDGVKEKLAEMVISFIEKQVSKTANRDELLGASSVTSESSRL